MSEHIPVALIRTSDRAGFKRCRRQWAFSSHLHQNLEPSPRPSYFWLGTGGHYALEDYHGYNHYGHPVEAFLAYEAAYKASGISRPDDMAEQTEMAVAILSYYVEWLETRDPLETLWVDGVPQCEVNIKIDLPLNPQEIHGPECRFTGAQYGLTIDRVTIDEYRRLWPVDYKFMKNYSDTHLDTDAQITSYLWGVQMLYPDYEIGGFIYQQHLKKTPKEPDFLASGKYTTSKTRLGRVPRSTYRRCLLNLYGAVNQAPAANLDALNYLATLESPERDQFIKRDRVERNPNQLAAMGDKILMETVDMTDPDLALYPNPTKDCGWDCSFHDICIAIDRNDDWEDLIESTMQQREPESTTWRAHLPHLR